MAIKGFAAVVAALVVVAGGMSTSAFAAKGEVKQLKTPQERCATNNTPGSPEYDQCVANRTGKIAIKQEQAKNKALAKCDLLSPKNAKECKCAIDPALPVCSASLS